MLKNRFRSIPGINDIKGCVSAIRDIIELGVGLKGLTDSKGQYLEKWVTYRELPDLIRTNSIIAGAISNTVNNYYGLNDPVDTTIVSGVITLTGSGLVTVSAETGTADALDQIAGLLKGQSAYIVPASGHTITITAGAYLKMPSPTFILSGYRIATFDCMGENICVMRSSSANRT